MKIDIGETQTFITGHVGVDIFKARIKDYVDSEDGLSFGCPSGGEEKYETIDKMPFPLHIMASNVVAANNT